MAWLIPDEYSTCPDCGEDLRQLRDGDCILVCPNGHHWVPPSFSWEPRKLKKATMDGHPLTGVYYNTRRKDPWWASWRAAGQQIRNLLTGIFKP